MKHLLSLAITILAMMMFASPASATAGVQPGATDYDVYNADNPPRDTGQNAVFLNNGEQLIVGGVNYWWDKKLGRYNSQYGTQCIYFYGEGPNYTFQHYGPDSQLIDSGEIRPLPQ